MTTLVWLNNYLHDFSAALWVATLVCGWLVARAARGRSCGCPSAVFGGLTRLFWASFAGVTLFGAGRALAYARYEWNDGLGGSQVAVLAIKHAAFTVLVVGGIAWWLRTARALRPAKGAAA